jgi:hypothetical protein
MRSSRVGSHLPRNQWSEETGQVTGVAPSNLKAVSVDKSIALVSPVHYDEYYSMAGNRFFYTISSGKYVAKYEDAGGVYYEGSSNCFTIRIESDSFKKDGKPQPTPMSYRCGIFMPAAASAEPKLYFYRDAGVSQAVFGNTQAQVVDAKGAPSTSPGAAVGAGVGMGIVGALDAAELNNLHFYQDQPKPGQIRKAMQ